MSLINDALKQARQAQQDAAPPPAPDLQFRPIEPNQYTRHTVGVLWPVSLLVLSLVLLLFIWQQAHRFGLERPPPVQARVAMPADPPASPPATPPALPASAAVVSTPAPAPAPAMVAPAATTDMVAVAAVPMATNPPTAIDPDSGIPNPVGVVEVAPPKPAPPKLQAVIFSPVRPSVIISGRTLFVGDRLEELRVVAIGRDNVTLAGAGKTNVLKLAE
ncbi:MAG TPA: hypothetical protein VMU04_20520 [Candidatus Acidoferrum sp.]|nr:hypothetical protein [Candidatus Acidoferrum sp.]